jgi:hypothetical protein
MTFEIVFFSTQNKNREYYFDISQVLNNRLVNLKIQMRFYIEKMNKS